MDFEETQVTHDCPLSHQLLLDLHYDPTRFGPIAIFNLFPITHPNHTVSIPPHPATFVRTLVCALKIVGVHQSTNRIHSRLFVYLCLLCRITTSDQDTRP